MVITEISLVLFLCLLGLCIGDGNPGGGGSVSSIVTQEFFNNIINEAGNGCTGEKFYTRNSFIAAADSFPDFTTSVTKREIAAMFAHFTHETGHFCYVKRSTRHSRDNCDNPAEQTDCGGGQSLRPAYKSYRQRRRPYCKHPAEATDCIPPPPGVGYCKHPEDYSDCTSPPAGKGYSRRGQSFSLHFLRQSELVASNPTVTFRTGLRLWMNSVRPVLNQGFGATIRAISGVECNGENSGAVNARIAYYKAYCGQLDVDPGPNLRC